MFGLKRGHSRTKGDGPTKIRAHHRGFDIHGTIAEVSVERARISRMWAERLGSAVDSRAREAILEEERRLTKFVASEQCPRKVSGVDGRTNWGGGETREENGNNR
jgi:hypothetical protein